MGTNTETKGTGPCSKSSSLCTSESPCGFAPQGLCINRHELAYTTEHPEEHLQSRYCDMSVTSPSELNGTVEEVEIQLAGSLEVDEMVPRATYHSDSARLAQLQNGAHVM